MHRFVLAFTVLASVLPALGEWHPTIVPPEQTSFNWPPPRVVGEKDFFTIARDGQGACSIVVPEGSPDQPTRAEKLLKLYFDLVTGADFEIKSEPFSGRGIYVGDTEMGKKVPLDLPDISYATLSLPNLHGFLVQTLNQDTLIIRGLRDAGTFYGVIGFLREYAGVQRYWPAEPGGIGDVYEHKPTLAVPKLTWKDWPYLISRRVGFNAKGWELSVEQPFPTMFSWYRNADTLPIMHNFFKLVPAAEFGKTHPEYFPLLDGKRKVLSGSAFWQPCVSNPEVVDICVRKILEHFGRNPYQICHALSVNDGGGNCECEKCKAMDSPEDVATAQLTSRYVKFMNAVTERVAAKYPNRLIGFIIYGGIRDAPKDIKLHPNLVPYFCTMGQGLYSAWDEWMAAGVKNMGHYGYHNDNRTVVPRVNPHQEARRILYLVGSNIGRGYYKEFNPTYQMDAHVASLMADMMWDPRLDVDKYLDRYYSGMFKEAAGPMRTFYEGFEAEYEKWLKTVSPDHPYGPDMTDLNPSQNGYAQFETVPEAMAEKAWKLLLQAESMARDSKVKARIAMVKTVFGFALPCVREYWRMQQLAKASNAQQAEKLAREVLKATVEKADYKARFIEVPEMKRWTMYNKPYYASIQRGAVPPEVTGAIDLGFEKARLANPGDLAPWERLANDANPIIAQAAKAQVALAKDVPGCKTSLVGDLGFEQSALKTPGTAKGDLVLSELAAHSGKKSGMLASSPSFIWTIPFEAKPGEKILVSLWHKVDELSLSSMRKKLMPMKLIASVSSRKGQRTLRQFTHNTIPAGTGWEEFRFYCTTPAQTTAADLRITVSRQPAGARMWLDDISVVRIPVPPVISEAAPPERPAIDD